MLVKETLIGLKVYRLEFFGFPWIVFLNPNNVGRVQHAK